MQRRPRARQPADFESVAMPRTPIPASAAPPNGFVSSEARRHGIAPNAVLAPGRVSNPAFEMLPVAMSRTARGLPTAVCAYLESTSLVTTTAPSGVGEDRDVGVGNH